MRRSLTLALLALGASGEYLEAQRCPANQAARFRPSLRHGLELTGRYTAPFDFVCGAPATVRVRRSGAELTATLEGARNCPQARRERWSGLFMPGQESFPVRVFRADGGSVSGTAWLSSRCAIEVSTGRGGATAYHRTDGDCARAAQPVVVFIGGLADQLNRNVVRVFCAYDAAWERTQKLYFTYSSDLAEMRRAILDRAVREDARAPVVLVGHSYGGDAAYRLAEALAADSVVRLLVTLDPVSRAWEGAAAPRPAGVPKWVNVRVGSTPGLSSCGLAGALGGAWGPQPAADAELRFPADPAKDDPDDDHCKTEQMFLLDEVQAALAVVR